MNVHVLFWHCQSWNFWRKNVIPPIMHKIFRYNIFSDTLQGCSRRLSVLRGQNFSTTKCDTPPFIRKQFSESKTFSKTVGLIHKNFGHCEQTISGEKSWHSFYAKTFSILGIFRNIEGMPTNFFGTVIQIIFVEKWWHPYYAEIISTPDFFWNFEAMSTRFSALWDRKVLTA